MDTKAVLEDLARAEDSLLRSLQIAVETCRVFEESPQVGPDRVAALAEEFFASVDFACSKMVDHSLLFVDLGKDRSQSVPGMAAIEREVQLAKSRTSN